MCCRPQKLRVPDLVCRDTLPSADGCFVLLLLPQSNLRHCEVLRNLSQCTEIYARSSKELVLANLFEDFHALQEIELILTSWLLGRHCRVLVGLEETLRRRLRAGVHLMSLLKS